MANPKTLKIPTELRSMFLKDPENFIRDIACISTESVRPFFKRTDKIIQLAADAWENPFDDDTREFDDDFYPEEHDHFRRFMHIDLGLTKDAVGISMCHAPRFVGRDLSEFDRGGELITHSIKVPEVEFDFLGRIKSVRGEEILLGSIREIIYEISRRGYYIAMITYDGFQCLAGDTQVALLDGRSLSIEEISKEFGDKKEFWVYAFDGEKIVPAIAKNARRTGESVKTLRVHLDNGEVVECTANHPFMDRTGEYIAAGDLKVGQALMPFKTKQLKPNPTNRVYYNHKVVKIEEGPVQDVYDIEVPEHHNFALSSGIFVHNSVESIQILRSQGYKVARLSVDRTATKLILDKNASDGSGLLRKSTDGQVMGAMQALKDTIYDDRLIIPFHEYFEIEAKGAEIDYKKNKVDHKPRGTIDLLQSMAGGTYNLVNNEFEYIDDDEDTINRTQDDFYDNIEVNSDDLYYEDQDQEELERPDIW